MKANGIEFEKGQQVIKIKKPNTLVRPFNPGDQILDTAAVLLKIKLNKEQERKKRLEEEIKSYKDNLVAELHKIEELVDANQFNTIPMIEIGDSTDAKSLNIMGDKGNFNKHIEHLRNIRVEIMSIDKFIRENS